MANFKDVVIIAFMLIGGSYATWYYNYNILWMKINYYSFRLDVGAKLLAKLATKYATYDLTPLAYQYSEYLQNKREKYFYYVNLLDLDQCLSLLVCQVCADPTEYGVYGERVSKFFKYFNPVPNHTESIRFKVISDIGFASNSTEDCHKSFVQCRINTKRLSIVGRKKLYF